MSFWFLLGLGLLGIHVGVRHLGSLSCATDLGSHQKGDPDRRDDAGDDIAVADGQKETLNSLRLGGKEVIEGGNGRSEGRQGYVLGHG